MGEVAKENEDEGQTGDVIGQYQIVERKKWEQRCVNCLLINKNSTFQLCISFHTAPTLIYSSTKTETVLLLLGSR